jgi:hypothetical protein
MTRTPAPSRRFAIVAIACHAAIAAWCILTCIERSGRPGNYYAFRNSPEQFVYPTHDVAVWCGVIVLELAITAWVLLRSPSLAAASLMLGLLSGLVCALLLPLTMHAPPYFGFHVIFLLFSAVWLVLVAILAWLASLSRSAREPE